MVTTTTTGTFVTTNSRPSYVIGVIPGSIVDIEIACPITDGYETRIYIYPFGGNSGNENVKRGLGIPVYRENDTCYAYIDTDQWVSGSPISDVDFLRDTLNIK